MRFRKILCPVDFSPGSEQALRTAALLAKRNDAELVVAHTWYVPPLAYAGEAWMLAPDLVDTMVEEDTRGLEAALATARGLGARATSVMQNGVPSDRILTLLEEDPSFDLVVVGTHGRTGLARVVLGSVAEQVVRRSPCSVLAARPQAGDRPFHTVLCPIDFSDSSRDAIELANGFGTEGSELTLMHAIELPTSYGQEPTLMHTVAELDRTTTAALERWAEAARKTAHGPVTAVTRRGRAGAQILGMLEEGTFDLVVMGTHGRTGIRRALLGSVAEKVVRHAPCSVLVARKRA